MSNSNHTPGEWKLELADWPNDETQGFCITVEGKAVPLCVAGNVYAGNKVMVLPKFYRDGELSIVKEHYTPEEVEANGRLLTHSPKLYSAALKILEHHEATKRPDSLGDEPGISELRDAVAMVEGKGVGQ